MITRRQFIWGAGAVAALATGTAGYAVGIEPFRMTIKRWPVTLAGWPAKAEPLRIVALADFHVARPWMTPARIRRIASAAMALKPNLIALLGDYLPGVSSNWAWGFPSIEQWSASLAGLEAPLGVFAILGNHDTEVDACRNAFARLNIPLLENTALRIACGTHDFWLAGLGDIELKRDDLDATLKQAGGSEPVILFAHEPEIFDRVKEHPRAVALTLSGHTHGGQVWLPFYGSAANYIGATYIYGRYGGPDRQLIVSGGLGMTRYPVRFLMPPEITVIDILPPAAS
jgi:uncharacterized protein